MAAAHDIYSRQLSQLRRGYPLYYPEPHEGPVKVGDVGYTRDGAFYRLFNVLLSRDHPDQVNGTPDGFETISMGNIHTFRSALDPGPLCSESVTNVSGSIGAPSGVLPLEASFNFTCTSGSGAILMLGTTMIREVAVRDGLLETYLRQHCLSWHEFANALGIHLGFGDLMLVSECSKVGAWSSAVYSNSSDKFALSFSTAAPFFPPAGIEGSRSIERWGRLERRRSEPSEMDPPPKDHTVFIKAHRLGLRHIYRHSIVYWVLKAVFRQNRVSLELEAMRSRNSQPAEPGWGVMSTSSATLDAEAMMMRPNDTDYHPAVVLLALAMESADSDCMIVHDDDWCSATTEDWNIIEEYNEIYFSNDFQSTVQAGITSDSSTMLQPHTLPSLATSFPQIEGDFGSQEQSLGESSAFSGASSNKSLFGASPNVISDTRSPCSRSTSPSNIISSPLSNSSNMAIPTDSSDDVRVLDEPSISSLYHVAEPPPQYPPNERQNIASAMGQSKEHAPIDAKSDSHEKLLTVRDKLEKTQYVILSQKRVGLEIRDSSWRAEHSQPKDRVQPLITRLGTVFDSIEQYKQFLNCVEADAPKLLDMMQTLLDAPGLSAKIRRNLLVATQRLSHNTGLYPTCYNLEEIEMVSERHPIAAGAFVDIYKGRFRHQVVCLKVIRVSRRSQFQSFSKKFLAEAILWGQLSHLNLLPFYGVYQYDGRLCLVAPWMEYGDVTQFLKEHADEDRGLLVLDVGSGVAYLHTHDIVHGDLKGANILVTSCRRACVADFGLSSVSDSVILHWGSHAAASSVGGSTRWQAPELLDLESDQAIYNSKASDVYAFSCIAYEIFTGYVPFFEHPRESTVMIKVTSGEKPSRSHSSSHAWLTETAWSLMEACWSTDPSQRPNISDVVSRLSSTTVVDDRPLESNDATLSPAAFRESVGGRTALPSVEELEEILTRGHK